MASGARSKFGACCDRKSRAACAQSFALWQQATVEITRRDHSIIACLRHIYNGVILHAYPVRGESHNQRNTTGEVATTHPFSNLRSFGSKFTVLQKVLVTLLKFSAPPTVFRRPHSDLAPGNCAHLAPFLCPWVYTQSDIKRLLVAYRANSIEFYITSPNMYVFVSINLHLEYI